MTEPQLAHGRELIAHPREGFSQAIRASTDFSNSKLAQSLVDALEQGRTKDFRPPPVRSPAKQKGKKAPDSDSEQFATDSDTDGWVTD